MNYAGEYDGELLRASGPLLLACRSKFDICAEERPLGIPREPNQNGSIHPFRESEFFNHALYAITGRADGKSAPSGGRERVQIRSAK